MVSQTILRLSQLSRPMISRTTTILPKSNFSTRSSVFLPLSSTTGYRSATLQNSCAIKSPNVNFQSLRFASSGALTKDDIQRRILEVLSSFEKCDPAKITPTASFTSDLGLDSLDAVEVVMAIEEEFSIEIPDEEADQITTVSEAISYIVRTPEAI